MSGNSILETLNCSRDTPEGRQPAENAETRRHFREPSREEADEEHEKDRFRALCQSTKIDKGLGFMGIRFACTQTVLSCAAVIFGHLGLVFSCTDIVLAT